MRKGFIPSSFLYLCLYLCFHLLLQISACGLSAENQADKKRNEYNNNNKAGENQLMKAPCVIISTFFIIRLCFTFHDVRNFFEQTSNLNVRGLTVSAMAYI